MILMRSCRGVAGWAAVFILTFGVTSWAEEMFYREAQKDGQLYVFAQMREFAAWQSSGKLSVAVTRPGYGPNGETVVFDSHEAVNAYNFKHDKPGEVFAEETSKATKDAPSVRVGGTIFTDFTYSDEPRILDSDGNTVNPSAFDVSRAYINLSGNISHLVSFRITPDIRRLSTNTRNLGPSESVTSSQEGSLTVRLKYTYGQVNLDGFLTKGSWGRIGLQTTPFIDFYEGIYRYRFQGTTLTDREGFLSPADFGVSIHYNVRNDYGDVHVGVYNGETFVRSDPNDQKAVQIRGTLRPLPRSDAFKGMRLTAFYDADRYVTGGPRDRFVGLASFEHKYANAGLEYFGAKDQPSATVQAVKARGYSLWATPKVGRGVEGFLRYDNVKPNTDVSARKKRTIAGVAYWFPVLKDKGPLSAALLADYERVNYDALPAGTLVSPLVALGKATEKRFSVHCLFNF